MTVRIMTEAQKLSKQHHGQGYVNIMINNMICGIYWMETEFSVDSKENLRRQGYLIISPEAMADVAKQLSEEVDSGQLAKAVTWLNRYELFTING